ncbi:MAG TPA: hypothetical protein VGA42_07310 [Gemmatimonadales bacterium]|jgi:hypothetical protein
MRRASAVWLLLAGAGCDNEPLGPFPVTSATDDFELQATDVTGITTRVVYDWRNTGLFARVNHATTTTAGTASIVIRDAFRTIVYEHPLVPSLNQASQIGSPGTWTITLTLTDYSGTLSFRVQKAPLAAGH